jgi:predicted RNA-binding protein with PUA-like domain
MKYFLAKTEPSTYSIDDLAKEHIGTWDGVANPLAVQYLKSMQPDDKIYIYHSGKDPQIIGLAKAMDNSRPDPNNPRSWLVDFQFLAKFDNPVTLKQIKDSHLFDDTKLVRQGRLSVMEIPQELVLWLQKNGLQA